MKLDAHQHFWVYNSTDYSWIDESMRVLKRDYLPADLLPELTGAGFSGSVAVQARQSTTETRWLLDLADTYDFIKGVVGWVDLTSMEDLKVHLAEFTRSGKLAGVRHVVQDEPDDNFMLKDKFLQGISLLKDYHLTYDFLILPKHLKTAQIVVSMFPQQKFVVDHIAKPIIKDHIISPWKDDILKLSENRNVWCKLSGLVTEADLVKWKTEDFTPYLDVIFDAFGADRLMYGSDWPVCRLSCEYDRVLGIVEAYISRLPSEVQDRILGLNCKEFYGLN